jgi:hypothetical protein
MESLPPESRATNLMVSQCCFGVVVGVKSD